MFKSSFDFLRQNFQIFQIPLYSRFSLVKKMPLLMAGVERQDITARRNLSLATEGSDPLASVQRRTKKGNGFLMRPVSCQTRNAFMALHSARVFSSNVAPQQHAVMNVALSAPLLFSLRPHTFSPTRFHGGNDEYKTSDRHELRLPPTR